MPRHHRAVGPRPARIAAIGLLLLSAGVLVGAAPSPVPAGPGPMDPPPPESPAPIPTGPLFPVPSIDPLDAPSGGGAAVPMPEELVGAWYTGDVGSIGYVDPIGGQYSDGTSQGIAYTFHPDGRWQHGFRMSSALYGCRMTVLVFREGVLAGVDDAARIAVLDATLAQMVSEDTCVAANTYQRSLAPDDETLLWARTTDEFGEALLLRGPDTAWSLFRPVPEG